MRPRVCMLALVWVWVGIANSGSSQSSDLAWATFLGGSDYDSIEGSIDVDEDGFVYVGCQTRSQDIPTTPGAHCRTHNGGIDWYVAKLKPDGSGLVYGTFIGDGGDNWINTHNLVVDRQGNCYSSTCAWSARCSCQIRR